MNDFRTGLGLEEPVGAQIVTVSHSWGGVRSPWLNATALNSTRKYPCPVRECLGPEPVTGCRHFSCDFDSLRTVQGVAFDAVQHPGGDPASTQHIRDDPNGNCHLAPV